MSNTIKITANNEVQLPIYIKKGDGRYVAIMGPVEGKPDRFKEVQVTTSMVATYGHMDAGSTIKEIMSGEEVTKKEFLEAYIETTDRINQAAQE